jgi:hypothetical protein
MIQRAQEQRDRLETLTIEIAKESPSLYSYSSTLMNAQKVEVASRLWPEPTPILGRVYESLNHLSTLDSRKRDAGIAHIFARD